jgi:hypothetical protein
MPTPVIPRMLVASAQYARAVQFGQHDKALIARRQTNAARIRDHVVKVLADSPPLTEAEIAEITAHLRGES